VSIGTEWQSLRQRLEALSRSVADEIRAYPRPITACDAQFNHLLELRRLLPQELQRLEATAGAAPDASVAAFLDASPCAAALLEMAREK
jgi:hypothetical protein